MRTKAQKPTEIIREKLAKEAIQDKVEAKKRTSLKDFLEVAREAGKTFKDSEQTNREQGYIL